MYGFSKNMRLLRFPGVRCSVLMVRLLTSLLKCDKLKFVRGFNHGNKNLILLCFNQTLNFREPILAQEREGRNMETLVLVAAALVIGYAAGRVRSLKGFCRKDLVNAP